MEKGLDLPKSIPSFRLFPFTVVSRFTVSTFCQEYGMLERRI